MGPVYFVIYGDLDLFSFNTNTFTYMKEMFNDFSSLLSLNLYNFHILKITIDISIKRIKQSLKYYYT